MRITSITIGGTEWVSYAELSATQIVFGIQGTIGTCRLQLHVPRAAFNLNPIAAGMEVIVTTSSGRLWGGYVSVYAPKLLNANWAWVSLDCEDYTRLLDGPVIEAAVYGAQSDADLVRSLFAAYLPAVSTVEYVSPVAIVPSREIVNQSLRVAMEELVKLTQALWYVDAMKRLRYYAQGTIRAPFSLSEAEIVYYAPGGGGGMWGEGEWGTFPWGGDETVPVSSTHRNFLRSSFSYRQDFATPANKVLVIGDRTPDITGVLQVFVAADEDDGFVIWYDPAWPVPQVSYSYVYSTNEQDYWEPEAHVPLTEAQASYANLCNQLAPLDTTLPDYNIAGPQYEQSNVLIRFDTSGLPAGAVVESASLVLWCDSRNFTQADNPRVGVEYYGGDAWAISWSDFDSSGPAADACDYQSIQTTGWQQVAFPLLDVAARINTSGYTGFRLHLKTDAAPTYFNRFLVGLFGLLINGVDASPRLDLAYRIGGQKISAQSEDLASQSAHGVWQRTIVDAQIKTVEEAQLRADYEIAQFAEPLESGSLEVLDDGLEAGQVVYLEAPTVGVAADYLIRETELTWQSGEGTRTKVAFGDHKPDLVALIRKIALAAEER